ncbi:MAG: hypothetical protein ACJ8FY_21690 [Gemmataceae bacterium]
MKHLTIQQPTSFDIAACSLCGQERSAVGDGLCLTDGLRVVCHECGRKHEPALAALLDLARVAQRVGRMNRHTLVPSLGALLDLARAAENYSSSSAPSRQRAS